MLGQNTHVLHQTFLLCKGLLERGVDINGVDCHGQPAINYVACLGGSEGELEELYALWFFRSDLNFTMVDKFGQTPMDFVRNLPHRKKLLERMEAYVKEQ